MPVQPLDLLPDDARAWVFPAADRLSADAEQALLRAVDAFLAAWRAHGAPLTCGREWRDGRFLVVAVDQRPADASGCSIDGLFRTLRTLEPALGTTLLPGGLVYWRDDEGLVRSATRPQFAAHAATGAVRADTPVFDPSVDTLGRWRREFERPAGSSWHARWLAPATA
jgi:hypothetical protein